MENYSLGVNAPVASPTSFSPASEPQRNNTFGLSDATIRKLNPTVPVAVLEPALVRKNAEIFTYSFPGTVMYAVKCNPDKAFLQAIYAGGVTHFDVASLAEVKLIRTLLPFASIYFMHPIKAPEAIISAYHDYQVRAFVLDHMSELDKIIHTLPDATDLELFVRIAVPKGKVATDFSTKFGAHFDDAVELLKATAPHCAKLGVSFHVGTQCTDADVYYNAVIYAKKVIDAAGVDVSAVDVGGGFPAILDPENPPPTVQEYSMQIKRASKACGLEGTQLLCEVGRGMVASGGSLVVRVEGRKGDLLYLNDGTYGGLFEAGGSIGLPYPVRLVRKIEYNSAAPVKPFRFAGPTCDSVDMMKGPFMLPDDVAVGDWIAINQLGAYGEVSRTNFNGFGKVIRKVIRAARKRPTLKLIAS